MNLIDNESIEKFVMWAKENESKDIFLKPSQETASYFSVRRSEENYIMEYSFETMEELKQGLKKYSSLLSEQQLLKELTIQICQNRFKPDLTMSDVKESVNSMVNTTEKTLPDFVYVF